MADTPKTTPIMLVIVALLVGYAGYSGEIIKLAGLKGAKERAAIVQADRDTLASLQSRIDSAKRSLATESVEDVKQRTEAYRASLGVLRSLVPDQTEIANLIDDINIRAKVRGLQVISFTPATPVAGPEPFDTHTNGFAVVGRFNQVGAFLTDVASLRRIIVPTGVSLKRAQASSARFFGDTLSMLEAKFQVRTYVKAVAAEDSTNGT